MIARYFIKILQRSGELKEFDSALYLLKNSKEIIIKNSNLYTASIKIGIQCLESQLLYRYGPYNDSLNVLNTIKEGNDINIIINKIAIMIGMNDIGNILKYYHNNEKKANVDFVFIAIALIISNKYYQPKKYLE